MDKPHYGKEYTVQIEGDNAQGDGVARIGGEVVFVPGTAQGDSCLVRIVNTRSRYAWGELVRVLKPSPQRTDPECPVYPACGGCALRHIDYEEELALKAQRVRDAFARIGWIQVELEGITGAPQIRRYRNKALYPVRRAGGENVAGFYRRASHDVVPCLECELESEISLRVLHTVLDYMHRYNVRAYDEKSAGGVVRHVFVRSARDGSAIACIVAAKPHLPMQQHLVEMLRAAAPQLRGILLNVNTRRDNVVMPGPSSVLWGKGYIEETLLGKTFRLSADSFFQINPAQTENLYTYAGELLGTCQELLELYCGVGSIGICLSSYANRVTGVEIVPQAVEDAWENARRNGLENIRFFCADAAEAARRFCEQGERPDVVLVDPPRKGMDEACIAAIAQMAPERIVYISCNPATQARDCARLQGKGYRVRRLRAFDMFPRTAHVETVCLLSKLQSKEHIEIEVKMDELDLTSAESKATYEEIKAYVLEHTGLKVSHLYIAQVKQKYGIIERENYNKPKSENAKQPQCPPEKEKAITEALRHFGMI